MKKSELKKEANLIYDEQGADDVSMQIMDAYNSGVIDHEHGRFVWNDPQE